MSYSFPFCMLSSYFVLSYSVFTICILFILGSPWGLDRPHIRSTSIDGQYKIFHTHIEVYIIQYKPYDIVEIPHTYSPIRAYGLIDACNKNKTHDTTYHNTPITCTMVLPVLNARINIMVLIVPALLFLNIVYCISILRSLTPSWG